MSVKISFTLNEEEGKVFEIATLNLLFSEGSFRDEGTGYHYTITEIDVPAVLDALHATYSASSDTVAYDLMCRISWYYARETIVKAFRERQALNALRHQE